MKCFLVSCYRGNIKDVFVQLAVLPINESGLQSSAADVAKMASDGHQSPAVSETTPAHRKHPSVNRTTSCLQITVVRKYDSRFDDLSHRSSLPEKSEVIPQTFRRHKLNVTSTHIHSSCVFI